MMTLGNFTHRVSLKLFVGYGMILSALFYSFFAIYYQIFKVFSIPLMVVMMCFNGFFQCTGWPGLMGIMGNWFGKGKTGIILGIWAINANIGNIIAELMCNIL
jgi:MFS transporter, OPA family, solute carrier family 37 (glycerol-3-phosphate transporter), member 1/2